MIDLLISLALIVLLGLQIWAQVFAEQSITQWIEQNKDQEQ